MLLEKVAAKERNLDRNASSWVIRGNPNVMMMECICFKWRNDLQFSSKAIKFPFLHKSVAFNICRVSPSLVLLLVADDQKLDTSLRGKLAVVTKANHPRFRPSCLNFGLKLGTHH